MLTTAKLRASSLDMLKNGDETSGFIITAGDELVIKNEANH